MYLLERKKKQDLISFGITLCLSNLGSVSPIFTDMDLQDRHHCPRVVWGKKKTEAKNKTPNPGPKTQFPKDTPFLSLQTGMPRGRVSHPQLKKKKSQEKSSNSAAPCKHGLGW